MNEKDRTARTLVNTLMYADDMAVMDSECGNETRFLVELDEQLCRVGMMMNVKKTKMMVLNGEIKEPIELRGEKIEIEKTFPYLGVNIKAEQSSSCEEVAIRISKAVKVFNALYHPLWKRKQVSVVTKMSIYRAAVLPTLLYGSETWVLGFKEITRLEVFQMRCLRTIIGVTRLDHIKNDDIRERTQQCTVEELVRRCRMRWLGHVARMKEDRLPPQLLYGSLFEGKAKRGRPVGRWKDMIEADLKKTKLTSWYNVVQDRESWRRIVNGEGADADMRRKGRKKAQERVVNRKEEKVEEIDVEMVPELICPKCGKAYMSRRGGWYQKHIDTCEGQRDSRSSRSSVSNNNTNNQNDDGVAMDGGSASGSGSAIIGGVGGGCDVGDDAGRGGGDGGDDGGVGGGTITTTTGLICHKCGKIYKSNKGGWYKKHVGKCGSSQPLDG